MPLVVPGLMDQKPGEQPDKHTEWQQKLLGKKIGDSNNATTFAKTELPKEHRIVNEGDMMTTDYKPDRVNVHVGRDGTVHKVTQG